MRKGIRVKRCNKWDKAKNEKNQGCFFQRPLGPAALTHLRIQIYSNKYPYGLAFSLPCVASRVICTLCTLRLRFFKIIWRPSGNRAPSWRPKLCSSLRLLFFFRRPQEAPRRLVVLQTCLRLAAGRQRQPQPRKRTLPVSYTQ